jgi:TATA box binding protein associated factor (TAF)
MTEDRSQRSRERRYAVLPKETVQVYAESVGLSDLTEEVSSQLAEDVSYRLRDIIQVRLFARVFHVISLEA